MLNNFIVQIYEVQDPAEAQMLLDMGINHIGSVILSESNWKNPLIKETVHVVQASKAKSSLIPLFSNNKTIAVHLPFIGFHKQVIILFHCDFRSFRSINRLFMDSQIGGKPAVFICNSIDFDECRVCVVFGKDRRDGYFLYQAHLKGIDRINLIDKVIPVSVGRGISQGAKGF